MKTRHPERIKLDLPARFTYLHLLSDCIADLLKLVDGLHDTETLIYNVQLAAHEACTNIVNHAYGSGSEGRIRIDLTLEFDPPRLTIDLQDTGKPFDELSYTAPNLDAVQVHGYGLFLIRNLMDSVTYTPQVGRNHWNLTKNLSEEGIRAP
ncbi:MAG: ATP-binding protein [Oscillochloridaceae bacterium umkhey_bin13]